MNYVLTSMVESDLPEVIALWERTAGVGLSESDSPQHLSIYLSRNPGMSYVARHGRELVGAVLCGHDGRRGYLHHLAVAEAHRRRGVGKRLVDACMARLAAAGIHKCNLFVFADNSEGEKFWRETGWTKREDLRMMQQPVGMATAPSASAACTRSC